VETDVETEERWRRGRLIPALYDHAVEHEGVARLAARLMWGADVRPLLGAFTAPGRLPPGSAVLDVPCGGGVAFRGLPPGDGLHYVAADLSPAMLGRARAQAARRGLRIGFAQASVDGLPFAAGTFDLCVTYNGLHCFPDPASAVAEMARVLRAGAVLRGTALVTGVGARQDALAALLRRSGEFGPPVSAAELRGWLADAGLRDVEVALSGALAYFTAAKPA
jgi:SAM-dependent methyltransferase